MLYKKYALASLLIFMFNAGLLQCHLFQYAANR
jgi:hypothetical protein